MFSVFLIVNQEERTVALIKREYICPYCFNKHKINEVKFRCSNDDHIEEDKVYGNYWGDSNTPILSKVIDAPEKKGLSWLKLAMPETAVCEECPTKPVSRIRICPSCHSTLPSTIADYEDYIFAVIGAKNTGKSHYIALLIDRIKNEIGNAYNCFLKPENDDTIRRYKEDFYNPLFKDKQTLRVTQSANTE